MALPSFLLISVLCVFSAGLAAEARGDTRDLGMSIDAGRTAGRVKALQDVGIGPLLMRGSVDVTRYYKELGIHYVRLHDVPWVYDNVQDMNYVFRDDAADAADPARYDFALTDYYIESITAAGFDIIYRLGYSAEDYVPRSLQHVDPPRSFEQWAAVADHIAQHYDTQWTGAGRHPVKYWEIWNEPDNIGFWTGSPEQYFRLYAMVAKRLKSRDATLKVGGPALAGHLDFLEAFLKYCRDQHAPLDFVSWHSYAARPEDVAAMALRVHGLMDRYGFASAESVLDEWNYDLTSFTPPEDKPGAPYVPGGTQKYYEITRSAFGAAFDAAVLIALQDARVDIANFYTGTNMFMGLFTYAGDPTKAYYAFLAFHELLAAPDRVSIEGSAVGRVSALAGLSADRKALRVLLAYTGEEPLRFDLTFKRLPWGNAGRVTRRIIDRRSKLPFNRSTSRMARDDAPLRVEFDGPTVELITLHPR